MELGREARPFYLDSMSKELERLYHLYLHNECTAEELELFFKLLEESGDTEIMALMSETWDNIPVRTIEVKLDPPLKSKGHIRRWVSVAAAVLIVTASVLFFRETMRTTAPQVHLLEAHSGPGKRRQLNLADGTKVWLGPGSRLDYPVKFTGTQRQVSLQGEAFFEVAHDAEHPFIIRTGKVSTAVLGTSFNISAYKNSKTVDVTLVTGKVAVELQTGSSVTKKVMLPNQRIIAELEGDRLTKIDYPDAARFLNRRLGIYDYKGATLGEVVGDLRSQYGLDIQVASEVSDKAFYGNLNLNNAVGQTLDKLCLVMETTWEKRGGQYVIIK